MQTETLYKGDQFTLTGIVKNGRGLASDYIDGLQPADRKKLVALLQRIGDVGPPANPEKFKKVSGSIFEIKSYQDRLACFFDGRSRLVVTHGFKKKKDKWPPEELMRAEALRAEYLG